MLLIRDAQMAVFAERVWENFVESASAILLDSHADLWDGVPAAISGRRVHWSLKQARAAGLRDAVNLMDYSGCLLTYGAGFPLHPLIAAALCAPDQADARWGRLYAGMPDHVWRELALLHAPDDWLAVDEDSAAGENHAE
jgi:hypothetical protein